jgi:ElaB/YqjD/DUF883 family membrane-anchored ribosome-binding protein
LPRRARPVRRARARFDVSSGTFRDSLNLRISNMNANLSATAKSLADGDDLAQQIAVLRADLAKIATTAGDTIGADVSDAGRRIEQGARDARATATTAVLDHPLAAISIAAGLGFLLGMITRRA